MDDRSSDHDPQGENAPDAVARLRALRSEFSGGRQDADGTDAPLVDCNDAPVAQAAAVAGTAAPSNHDTDTVAARRAALRIIEAVLFAASEPVAETKLAAHLPAGTDVAGLIAELEATYAGRGVSLVRVSGRWAFRTAADLSYLLEKHAVEERRLSRAGLETLSIIAYHQPVTRAEIEAIRGVTTSKGTLDVLLETGWVRPRGRRRAPGKPITYGTTESFLEHFGLDTVKDLPGLAELRGSGLLDGNLPPDFKVPEPSDVAALMPDELPLDAGDEDDSQGELSLVEEDADEAGADEHGADGDASGQDDRAEPARET